jgi:hypothetical protein
MNAVEAIREAFLGVGYRPEAVIRNFAFADVLSAQPSTLRARLVAFTRTPPSYRSAALAVIEHEVGSAAKLVHAHRSLGAPFILVIEGNAVTVWQVRSVGFPRALETVHISNLPGLFARNQQAWNPDAIHRAKSIGRPPEPYQIDFIDLGLLPAIEGELHLKLDRLLVESLNLVRERFGQDGVDPRTLFRVIFRLLAAKVLEDRGHPLSSEWSLKISAPCSAQSNATMV